MSAAISTSSRESATELRRRTGGDMRAGSVAVIAALLAACGPAAPQAQPRSSEAVELLRAFKAAYGQPAPITVTVQQPDAGGPVQLDLSPSGFVQVDQDIVALVSKAEGHDCGRSCTGTLTFTYLRRTADGYEVLGSWRNIGGESEFGVAPPWTVRHDLFDGPAIELRETNGGAGCSVTTATLIEFQPLGPIVRTTGIIVEDHSSGDQAEFFGRISPIAKGREFQVTYTGTTRGTNDYRSEPNSNTFDLSSGPVVKALCSSG